MGVDFDLYSTYADALADTHPWTHCGGFDNPGVGFPGNCGPQGAVNDIWNSIIRKDGI